MAWIKHIPPDEACGKLKRTYARVARSSGQIDNVLLSHSLRPHALEGHMALYKSALHHGANTLPRWLREAVGLYVSLLNACHYCVEHHYRGLCRALPDDKRAPAIRTALERRQPEAAFAGNELPLFRYAEVLTLRPAQCCESDVQSLRAHGYDDGQILELNQVVAYFAYANRTVLGLGTTLDGELREQGEEDGTRGYDRSGGTSAFTGIGAELLR